MAAHENQMDFVCVTRLNEVVRLVRLEILILLLTRLAPPRHNTQCAQSRK